MRARTRYYQTLSKRNTHIRDSKGRIKRISKIKYKVIRIGYKFCSYIYRQRYKSSLNKTESISHKISNRF